MSRIDRIFQRSDLDESLQPAFAPHALGNAQDRFVLGWANGFPFRDQGRVQLFELRDAFTGKDRGRSVDAVL